MNSFPPEKSVALLDSQVAAAYRLRHRTAFAQLATDLTIVFASANFCVLCHEPANKVVGRLVTDLLWEFVGMEATLASVLAGETPDLVLEDVNRSSATGDPVYYDIFVQRLREPGLEPGLLLIAEDVTHQAQLEQSLTQERNELRLVKKQLMQANDDLQRLSRLKSLFLSIAAHDLATPLTAIQGYTYLLLNRSENLTTSQLRDVGIVAAQAGNMERLVRDFLDLDQLEYGMISLQRRPAELNELVNDVATALDLLVDKQGLQMRLHFHPAPIKLSLDADRIRRVCYNLIGNAIKYTDDGGEVIVSTRLEENMAVVQVSDTGAGMTEEQLSNLFQIYYRTDEAVASSIKGTGLGLYIVKLLVDAHGGRIDVASEYGIGSTFTVYLPLTESM